MAQLEIPVGVGVHAGVAYFGAVGTADGLTNITAIGDSVNTAARLAAKAGAGEILISDYALQAAGVAGDDLEQRSLELKGISDPVLVRVMQVSNSRAAR
jgi:adenylate cyclase